LNENASRLLQICGRKCEVPPHSVPGAVIEEPWQDFAYNRTFALERLHEVDRYRLRNDH
jgi:hypothetical protein